MCSSVFRVNVVTLPELSSALRRLSRSRATGSDGVTVQLLHECFEVAGPIVLHVINHSPSNGVVPTLWKHAMVVPIYKSGDKTLPANYRPVGVLNVISKLAERVVNLQLLSLPKQQQHFDSYPVRLSPYPLDGGRRALYGQPNSSQYRPWHGHIGDVTGPQ